MTSHDERPERQVAPGSPDTEALCHVTLPGPEPLASSSLEGSSQRGGELQPEHARLHTGATERGERTQRRLTVSLGPTQPERRGGEAAYSVKGPPDVWQEAEALTR